MQYLKSFVRKENLKTLKTADLIHELLRRMNLSRQERLLAVKSVHRMIRERMSAR